MPADTNRVQDLFHAATNLPVSDRAAFLAAQCGPDAELRDVVERLLAAADTCDPPNRTVDPGTSAFDPGLLTDADAAAGEARPPGGAGKPGSIDGPAASTVIAGRYTLVEVIGEGGMGSVFLAEQTEPVKRQVALKLIRGGMDSKAVLARFDAERQALAVMDHPNIARVYDGGTTPAGRPFFVMELVRGVPITKYCDENRLPVDARLRLFVAVCEAVQHAHQKGVIHRDLKPGNVLVTEVDGRPTPKVIDFGVAKATEFKLTDLSFSDVGAVVGTPAYMSPEQADPSSMDIDTRTDVYALGVILYELLVGSPPIDARQFKRGALLEMLRMVRESELLRPSTKLSAGGDLPNIAANRSIEPAKLAKSLRGELDWGVMKAIEKDRARRYETAKGLARDIQRYLADEVIEARPPSKGHRLRKFACRHKGQVIAVTLVMLALVAGVIGTTLGLIDAIQRRPVGSSTPEGRQPYFRHVADGEACGTSDSVSLFTFQFPLKIARDADFRREFTGVAERDVFTGNVRVRHRACPGLCRFTSGGHCSRHGQTISVCGPQGEPILHWHAPARRLQLVTNRRDCVRVPSRTSTKRQKS